MFNIDFTFLWTAINLLIIYLVVNKFLFKGLGASMEKRSESIAADIENGKQLKEEGEAYKRRYEEMLDEAAEKRREIINEATQKAARESESILNDAKTEAARIIAEARAESVREREKALEQLRLEVASLAISAASKVIEENMDSEKNRELVSRFLSDGEAA